MDRATALKKIERILGKSMAYRVNPKAATKEEREAARVSLPAATKEKKSLDEKIEARRAAILAADTEFQELKAARKVVWERVCRLRSEECSYKFTVGTLGMFFHVKAEGDSWEEVLEKLKGEAP